MYKFFYVIKPVKVGGVDRDPKISYTLNPAVYDEVMKLCSKGDAVLTYRKMQFKENNLPKTQRSVKKKEVKLKVEEEPLSMVLEEDPDPDTDEEEVEL